LNGRRRWRFIVIVVGIVRASKDFAAFEMGKDPKQSVAQNQYRS